MLRTKGGVDPELMLEILNNGAARSGLVSIKAPPVFRRDFSTNFSPKWLEKDMALMLESAGELGVPAPLNTLYRRLYQAAIAKGTGKRTSAGRSGCWKNGPGATLPRLMHDR